MNFCWWFASFSLDGARDSLQPVVVPILLVEGVPWYGVPIVLGRSCLFVMLFPAMQYINITPTSPHYHALTAHMTFGWTNIRLYHWQDRSMILYKPGTESSESTNLLIVNINWLGWCCIFVLLYCLVFVLSSWNTFLGWNWCTILFFRSFSVGVSAFGTLFNLNVPNSSSSFWYRYSCNFVRLNLLYRLNEGNVLDNIRFFRPMIVHVNYNNFL